MDTNVENYSIRDLLAILNIKDTEPTPIQVTNGAAKLINQLVKDNKSRSLVLFIESAREKVLNSFKSDIYEEDEDNEDNDDNAQDNEKTKIGNWWQNEYPEQTDEIERTKPTDRKNKVQIFDEGGVSNNAFVMNRERLGVLQSHPIPVVQGTINPNLKNLMQRIVSIDSQFRSNIIPYSNNNINAPSFNTDFSFDLSERLSNVISMKLNSIQIPTSWYTFDDSLGNTCFKYQVGDSTIISVNIPSGNYTVRYLNTYFSNYSPAISLNVSLDEITGKIIFSSTLTNVKLIFYDTSFFTNCTDNSCGASQMRINQNFGWYMGYRASEENILYTTLTNTATPLPSNTLPHYRIAQSPPNFYGPTYFLLVIDDYNNNRVNNSLVTITNVSNKLDLPSYYNTAIKNANNTFSTVGCADVLNAVDPSLQIPPSTLPYMTKSSPRQLTQSQLYSANEILYNRTTFSNRTFGPSIPDALALIPLRNIDNLRNKIIYDITGNVSLEVNQASQPYVDYGPTLAANERTYFGPVNIDRMRVRLLDDKGNLVNLHDVDWSFSLIIVQLYQY
jgi:hypothetical protein